MFRKSVSFSPFSFFLLWTSDTNIIGYISIVFVWSQYNGTKIEQWTIGYDWRQNQTWEEQYLDPTSNYITSVIVS